MTQWKHIEKIEELDYMKLDDDTLFDLQTALYQGYLACKREKKIREGFELDMTVKHGI